MNGRTQRSTYLFAALALCLTFSTCGRCSTLGLDCDVAKCFFGVKYERVRELVDNYSFGIEPPDNICSQTVSTLIISSELPSACGTTYASLREHIGARCATKLSAQPASCGSSPDSVTGYLITYAILYSFLILFDRASI